MGSHIIVDIDDVITKALLVESVDGSYTLKGMADAPTTVESPDLDVTIGVKNAIQKLEESSGTPLAHRFTARREGPETAADGDLFLCSSSSGGGLHMMVAGLIGMMSAESAQRAALGAGALLLDIFSVDDGRQRYQKVERMRSLNPDIFLLAGGTDGGNVKQVIETADVIDAADVKPRFGPEFKLPIIYAGNVEIRKEVAGVLADDQYAMKTVENVRPILEKENLGPAREGIYDAFMEHVIVHSPGYDKLLERVDESIIPTQAAIGEILYAYAEERGANLIGVDVGGATTDVYSVFNGIFNRSLNADFGMSYGICNIMKETGVENILRWIPVDIDEKDVRNIIGNMMIHLSEPRSPEEYLVQHAVAREAIRLGMAHHKTIATRLKGVQVVRSISDMFEQDVEKTLIKNMMEIDVIVGKGRVLSSAPRTEQAALILLDSLQPEGITEIMIDKQGTLPHVGMLSKVNREAALEITARDCLHNLGTCIAPKGIAKEGEEAMELIIRRPNGTEVEESIKYGGLKTLALEPGMHAEVEIYPSKRFDVGGGRGKRLKTTVAGGSMGLMMDARGRPLTVYGMEGTREWAKALDAYPAVFDTGREGG